MNTPFVCASCRRHLWRHLWRHRARSSQWTPRASFSSDNDGPPPADPASTSTGNVGGSAATEPQQLPASPSRLVPLQVERFAQVVEEDFVQRLQQGRLGTEDEWGPYSTPRPPRDRATRLSTFALMLDDARPLPPADPGSSTPSSYQRNMVLSNMSIGRSWSIRRREAATPLRKDMKPPIKNNIRSARIPRVYRSRVRFAPPLHLPADSHSPTSAVMSKQFSILHESPPLHLPQTSQLPPSDRAPPPQPRPPRLQPRARGTNISQRPPTFDQWVNARLSKNDEVTRHATLQQGLPFTHSPPSNADLLVSETQKGRLLLSETFLFPIDDYLDGVDIESCVKSAQDFHRATVRVLAPCVRRWCRERSPPQITQPSLLLRRLSRALPEAPWMDLWFTIVRELLSEATLLASRLSQSASDSLESLLDEVMNMWQALLDRHHEFHPTDKSLVGQASKKDRLRFQILSRSENMKGMAEHGTKDFSDRWQLFLPMTTYARNLDEMRRVQAMAVLTIPLLRSFSDANADRTKAAWIAFQEFVARLILHSDFKAKLEGYLATLLPILQDKQSIDYARDQIRLMSDNAHIVFAEARESLRERTESEMLKTRTVRRHHDEADDSKVVMFQKRVGRAVEKTNVASFCSLWEEAKTVFLQQGLKQTAITKIPLPVYGSLLRGAIALRKTQTAVKIWNHMVRSGVEPDLAVWDAMLQGCWKTKDKKNIQDLWSRMIHSGVLPDARLWATRINALTKSGYWISGMDAFREMADIWVSAARAAGHRGDPKRLPDIADAPKPTVHCLNSLMSGLVRTSKFNEVAKVLSWAAELGIQPDAFTFNPLFKAALMQGNKALMDKLLNQMQRVGVQPDIATFTVMLDGIFRGHVEDAAANLFFDDTENGESSDQRQAAVIQLFETMNAKGLKPTAHTFATLITGLLQSHPPNPDAAYSVLRYMHENKSPMSAQVYTTLVSYHFQTPIPDVASIDSLWERARRDKHVVLDVVFFDRLIEGFSKLGEVGKAAAAMSQAGQRHKKPGWTALHDYVQALLRAGEWARAEELVYVVKHEADDETMLERQRQGRKNFWNMVRAYGLDRESLVPEV